MARGGLWIFHVHAMLVMSFDGNVWPLEPVLNAVPMWVRTYDVPWKKHNKAIGEALGGTLCTVKKVDVPKGGAQSE